MGSAARVVGFSPGREEIVLKVVCFLFPGSARIIHSDGEETM
jgi:hypothetical protein